MRRRALALSLAVALFGAASGCEKILGIHDSHARGGGAGSGGATGVAGTGGGAGTMGAAGTSGVGAAGTGPDAGPTRDATSDVAEMGDASPPKDAAAEVLLCPATTSQRVKALSLASGPNHDGGSATGVCDLPNAILTPDDPTGQRHFYAAVSTDMIAQGACGACLRVSTLQGPPFVVQVIDSTSGSNQINVDPAVLTGLDPSGNNLMVDIRFIPCAYGGNIHVQFRGKGDPAALLFNYTTRVTKVAIQEKGEATWTELTRDASNYWTHPGYDPGGLKAKLQITDEIGYVIYTDDIDIDGMFHDTGKQFPACTPPP